MLAITIALFLALFAPKPAQASVDPALAGKQAEQKISALGDEAIAVLDATQGDDTARRQAFENILNNNFDMETIARFAMGRYWAVATPDEQKRYTQLFNKMVVDVYSNRFSEYSGQKFEVLGNKPAGRHDVVVQSQIIPANGKPIKVEWRLRKNKVIDVIVEGVSMSVTQRSEFASIIQRGGGEVAALISHLEK
jgi:phospholipid transport system substrate-binding protein